MTFEFLQFGHTGLTLNSAVYCDVIGLRLGSVESLLSLQGLNHVVCDASGLEEYYTSRRRRYKPNFISF
jgi:hypothetical protein